MHFCGEKKCILRVERTVAHAADHQQRTRPESHTLMCVRTQRCRTRGLARERSRWQVAATHAQARVTHALARTVSLASGAMRHRYQSRTHGG